jgi:hypothetical protein
MTIHKFSRQVCNTVGTLAERFNNSTSFFLTGARFGKSVFHIIAFGFNFFDKFTEQFLLVIKIFHPKLLVHF